MHAAQLLFENSRFSSVSVSSSGGGISLARSPRRLQEYKYRTSRLQMEPDERLSLRVTETDLQVSPLTEIRCVERRHEVLICFGKVP
jgi:hypothetical protein